MNCRICDGGTQVIGEKVGRFAKRPFVLLRCDRCRFSFVENPWLDYAAIYDAAYYEGRGADPLVDYRFELAEPERTIRRYEWEGIVKIVGQLTDLTPKTRWLDFGCGNGGLVRHARRTLGCEVVGFEEGGIVAAARAAGIPILEPAALAQQSGSFDVVTAIEVLEHVAEPLVTLREIRRLLRPGGLFFYTTGNAAAFRDRLLTWGYFIPEIHISLYEPASMTEALRRTGFEPQQQGYVSGWDDVIRFKVLKNLKLRRCRAVYRALPWHLLGRGIDRHHRLTEFPVGRAI